MDMGVEQAQVGNLASRFPNFTEAQDLLLCSAWSNATNDPIVGINQKGDTFWVKAHAYWKNHKKDDYPDRTSIGLMQRFSRIKTDVNKFCGYLAQVESLSGYTTDDKIARAKEMFSEFEKPSKSSKPAVFAFEHCWRVLKNDQKWLAITSKKKSTSPDVLPNGSSPIYVSVDGDDVSLSPKSVERPIGRKLAKEGRTKRKGKFMYDSSAILEKIDQTCTLNEKHHNDDNALLIESDKKMDLYLEMERENLDLKKKKFEMEKQVFDMDIALRETEFINKDISSITDPDQVIFYQAMKRKISAKYQAM